MRITSASGHDPPFHTQRPRSGSCRAATRMARWSPGSAAGSRARTAPPPRQQRQRARQAAGPAGVQPVRSGGNRILADCAAGPALVEHAAGRTEQQARPRGGRRGHRPWSLLRAPGRQPVTRPASSRMSNPVGIAAIISMRPPRPTAPPRSRPARPGPASRAPPTSPAPARRSCSRGERRGESQCDAESSAGAARTAAPPVDTASSRSRSPASPPRSPRPAPRRRGSVAVAATAPSRQGGGGPIALRVQPDHWCGVGDEKQDRGSHRVSERPFKPARHLAIENARQRTQRTRPPARGQRRLQPEQIPFGTRGDRPGGHGAVA